MISSFAEFERLYGGLDTRSEASYGIRQYFSNGGQRAVILRVPGTPGPGLATRNLANTTPNPDVDLLTVNAINPGAWGSQLQVGVDDLGSNRFNLVVRRVREVEPGLNRVVATEVHRDLSMLQDDGRYVVRQVNSNSQLVHIVDLRVGTALTSATPPTATGDGLDAAATLNNPATSAAYGALSTVNDGVPPTGAQLLAALPILDRIAPQIFNMLCIPRMAFLDAANFTALVGPATTFCRERRAFMFVDPNVAGDTMAQFNTWAAVPANASVGDRNNAIYFPRLEIADPLADNAPRVIAPSGTLAGIYARTDTERGIWKAPAGTEAGIRGANIAGAPLTEADSGVLNPAGINALRSLPVFGNVVWGARTGEGANQRASEWKYVPVRRTALYIEESLFQGLQWVVFEPNDEPLWAQIRMNVGGFMQTLFRKGAFQGTSPRDAYMVRCDSTTTTQTDIDNGVVNILVGFAPLKPAEFVVIQIQQMTAQAAA
jgi:hypothetical protein